MKFKVIIYLSAVFLFGFISCKNDASTTEKISTETKAESKEIVPEVKNEVQVGNEKLVYKVSLGVLPDLSYKGTGMKVAKVHKDRPGFNGGMQDGDIVREINGKGVKDLIEYTKLLGNYKKGDSVVLTIERDGKTIKAKIVFD